MSKSRHTNLPPNPNQLLRASRLWNRRPSRRRGLLLEFEGKYEH